MNDTIQSVEAISIAIPRDTPYLGKLEEGLTVSQHGYFVRPGNRSVYSIHDQSTLVKITTRSGKVGWGECVAFVVPEATAVIINKLLGPFVTGRDPMDAAVIYHDMYDLMRVRGSCGGYYHDAIAAVDIAIWDLAGKIAGVPLRKLLGGERHSTLPAYVSGLPMPTLQERVDLARQWQQKGFNAFKYASAVSHEGTVAEMEKLRAGLGNKARILCDMHWKHTSVEAIRLIDQMNAYDLAVAEAPCQSEDIDGLSRVAASVRCPVGSGEEYRTVYEFRPRLEKQCMSVIQPEIGRTGITSFMEICNLGRTFHVRVMPHASIGIGIFQAASLQASSVLPHLDLHEYQHSIFDKNLQYITGDMRCDNGFFHLPSGPGLGVEPNEKALQYRLQ